MLPRDWSYALFMRRVTGAQFRWYRPFHVESRACHVLIKYDPFGNKLQYPTTTMASIWWLLYVSTGTRMVMGCENKKKL